MEKVLKKDGEVMDGLVQQKVSLGLCQVYSVTWSQVFVKPSGRVQPTVFSVPCEAT